MKHYFEAIITEQINRGLYLKKMIPTPLEYSELSGLADRCGRIIDSTIADLKFLREQLNTRYNENIRIIIREFRRCTRELELVESYGISPLNFQSKEMKYLNKLVFKIHQEINYPLPHPSVACLSTQYYFFNPFTNVIFIPFGESEFLLHIPDIFHELGHGILSNNENELKLNKLKEKYRKIIEKITEHYQHLISKKKRETGPPDFLIVIKLMHCNWKSYWVNEFLCDLFALFTLGPAYAYSHLHLSTKKSKNIYQFSSILPQTHPSDDSRMQLLIIGLKLLGFKTEALDLTNKWETMPYVSAVQPPAEYHYAYPKKLMEEIALLFLYGVKENNFPIITPNTLKTLHNKSIRRLLNKAWNKFWQNPVEYRAWEEKEISKLKNGYYF
jgi:hypothetical protein